MVYNGCARDEVVFVERQHLDSRNKGPAPIEPGRPVSLDARQRQAVVVSVVKWMKDPASVQFSGIKAIRNSRSLITVCGLVNGRNTAGSHVGMSPFVGVLMGPGADADFVLVGIGNAPR